MHLHTTLKRHSTPRVFMGELWSLLDSAQNSPNGIPEELVAMKMDEIKGRKVGSCDQACLSLQLE